MTDGPEPITAAGIHDWPADATSPISLLTPQRLKGIGQAIRYRLLADVLYALAGIEVLGTTPFAGLSAWADELVEKANAAYLGQEQANNKLDGVASIFNIGGGGSGFLGSLDLGDIWSNIIENRIKPRGLLATLTGGGVLPDAQSPSLLTSLLSGGLLDAANITNLADIGAIAQSKITGLTTALADRLDLASWQSLLNTFKGSGGGTLTDVANRIQNLSTSGQFNAAHLLGAIGLGNVGDGSNTLADLVDGVAGTSGGPLSTLISSLLGTKNKTNQIEADVQAGWEGTTPGGTPTAVLPAIQAIRSAVLGDYTIQTITSSTTWSRPASVKFVEFHVMCFGAGDGGTGGEVGSSTAAAAAAGANGGIAVLQLADVDVPSSVSVTVGAGGAGGAGHNKPPLGSSGTGAAGGAGAETSFGTILQSQRGFGALGTITGFLDLTQSLAGAGGNGAGYTTPNAVAGGDSVLGDGGAAGSNNSGSGNRTAGSGGNGDTVSTTGPSRGGGGGGGGGGYARTTTIGSATAQGGAGGHGGFPGGGGGGGGAATFAAGANTAIGGTGGTGANGCCILIYRHIEV